MTSPTKQELEHTAQVVTDLRHRIVRGEEVSDQELAEAISAFRLARSAKTQENVKKAEKKAAAAASIPRNLNDLFGGK